jgi:hypothetical protein
VQLISSNAAGSSAPEIKTGYITVLPAPISSSLAEGFETSTLPNSTWMLRNVSTTNTNWQQTNTAFASGSNSAFVSETAAPSSTIDIYSPTYDFSSMPYNALTFKWAGAERDQSSTSGDVFSLFFSTNCGATWVPRFSKTIKSTVAGVSGVVNGNFVPTSNQFQQEVITFGTLSSATNVLFRFRLVTELASSNNFYLDDINLTTITSINEQFNHALNLSVFPNPSNEQVSVVFDLLEDKVVEITLHDVLGKTIKTIHKQAFTNGNHSISIPVNDISKGIYFVKVNVNNIITSQKIIVD